MTHDELLDKIEREKNFLKTQCYEGSAIGTFTVIEALRAVVELHKPHYKYNGVCSGCYEEESGFSDYPCPTIQAIESAVNG